MKRIVRHVAIIWAVFYMKAGYGFQAVGDLPGEPIVGQICPDMSFNKVDFYEQGTVSIHGLRKKWVILDFWDRFCSGCIARFPIISDLQKKFRDSVQIFMVSYDDKMNFNRALYRDYHKTLRLEMPGMYNGSTDSNGVFRQYNVGLLPHVVIISPEGIVKAVTATVSEGQLQELLNGNTPAFRVASYRNHKEELFSIKYDRFSPYLVDGNGGNDSDFIYRSLLAKWKIGEPRNFWGDLSTYNRFEALGFGLIDLYRMAYLGKIYPSYMEGDSTLYGVYWPDPLLEVKDSGIFTAKLHPISKNAPAENVYSYSLIVPPTASARAKMTNMFRNDLKNYFGFEVEFESRKMPYWQLVITDSDKVEKLKTKGESYQEFVNKPWQSMTVKNASMKRVLKLVASFSGKEAGSAPVLDETGIKFNIDFVLEGIYGNYPSVEECLMKNGLGLLQGVKDMKVIVIKDSSSSKN